MVKRIRYDFSVYDTRNNDALIFRGRLKRHRCLAYPLCNRIVTIGGPFCAHHMNVRLGLEVRSSEALSSLGASGMGVYATRRHAEGALLGFYKGDRITDDEATIRYGRGVSVYALEDKQTINETRRYEEGINEEAPTFCDCALNRNVFSMINDANGIDGCENNVRFDYVKHKGNMGVVANRNIDAGEELLVCYGDEYWKSHGKKRTRYVTECVEST
jgi:SET domain-containing protein